MTQRASWRDLEKRADLGRAFNNSPLGAALLPDAAADADFERMINRLRGEPGRNSTGGKQ